MHNKMFSKDTQMTAVPSDAGHRLAFVLREIYRDCVPERVARKIDVDPRTVKEWLAGRVPNGTHLVKLCRAHGYAFTEFVMQGPAWTDDARMRADIAASRVRIELLEMKLATTEGAGECAEHGDTSHG